MWDISDSVCGILLFLVLFASRALTYFPTAWGIAVVFVMSMIVAIVTLYVLLEVHPFPVLLQFCSPD